MIKPAAYWKELGDGKVLCTLCPAGCLLTTGKAGICRSRFNQDGKLVTDNYGELVSLAMDPIEKKPLYHFHPGTEILSTGPNSCNFACVNCQNWTISQKKTKTMYFPPERLVETALQYRSLGVAFTYTEPMVWFEYIMDTAPLLREKGLKTVLVSNGYINPEPLEELLQVIDAINIDLKSIRPDFYKKICKAKLEPVLATIQRVAHSPVHLEITNLLIPTLNDSDKDIEKLTDFIASLSPLIPLHISAYRPDYKLDIPATPVETMLRAYRIASKKLKYVFLGNVLLEGYADSRCPQCGSTLVKRTGYYTSVQGVREGRCLSCGFETGIVQ